MKIRIVVLSIIFLLANIIFALAEDAAFKNKDTLYSGDFTYLIGPGDILEVKVWRHPDLDTTMVVRPDGKISFPLIGSLSVCDLTTRTVEDRITVGLSKVINEPKVTVNVSGFQSKKIFVLGEVLRPGVYPFEGRVTVLDAISKASGYKEDTAALKSVMLIRKGYVAKPEVLRLNIYNVISKGDLKDNIYLEPQDIIFVPKTFIANVNTFIDQFFTKTDPVLQYYLDIYDIRSGTPGVRSR